ncbi:MAG TPA: metal-dependent transcriptional regulator [Gemmatimonadaceae bacterium]|nr:metal-dependent transcriptional regulator [Gemmatimonadaceae bacterium]
MTASRAPKSAPNVELTGPVEDYLKAIYELERSGEPAETNAIARLLGIAPASVSGMIRRLARLGLIRHERYHGARLTAAGRRAALKTLRRHRVIEAYLTSALGYSWDRVHDEAERLEHAASDELIDRMAEAIGEPATDPHGAPIPSRDGTLEERSVVKLSDLMPGDVARVERVSDDDAERLRYLAELGIVPGASIQVIAREPFEGPIALRLKDTSRTIGTGLASQILVAPGARATRSRSAR